MFRFIKYFITSWASYPLYAKWYEGMKKHCPEELARMEESDAEKGIKPYKNRFDFAFRNAKLKSMYR